MEARQQLLGYYLGMVLLGTHRHPPCLPPGGIGMVQGPVASRVTLVVKNSPANTGDLRDADSVPGSGRSPGGEYGKPTAVFLPGESRGQRSLVGYSPRDCRSRTRPK